MKLSKLFKIGMPIILSSAAIAGTAVSLTSCSLINNLKKIEINKQISENLLKNIKDFANNKANDTADKLSDAIKKYFLNKIHVGVESISLNLSKGSTNEILKSVTFKINKSLIKEVNIEKDVTGFEFNNKSFELVFNFADIQTNIPNSK